MRQGFSLLELSIVLVIIGLLAGGVMTGQSLIRGAELRSVVTQYQQYRTALNAFRDKYQATPGDFKRATAFWGDQSSGTSACADAAVPDGTPGTCNGNGDGVIGIPGGIGNENYRAWQHLAMAGLIEGSYAGTISSSTGAAVAGVDMPAGKLSTSAWTAVNLSQLSTVNVEFGYTDLTNSFSNYLVFGAPAPAYWANTPIVKPEEAWGLDTKLDDGKPAFGKVRGFTAGGAGATGCVTAATSTAAYNVSYATTACAVGFIID